MRSEKSPTIAVASVENVKFSSGPEPVNAVVPETETRSVPSGRTLHVAVIPASPEIVPAVEQPKFIPKGSMTVGS